MVIFSFSDYTMVNFVKPALLGSSKEFKNQFQLPIEEGSKKESSPSDVRLMKQRSGILRHLLSGCLQIRGVSILTETIPPKTEHRITLRLTDMQTKLYKALIEHYRNKVSTTGNKRFLWQMVPTAQMITFHPQCLQKEQENERKKASRTAATAEMSTSNLSSSCIHLHTSIP